MLWSQKAETGVKAPANSLKAIADDLNPIPFSLTEVKSEDGETPPQTTATARPASVTRMSVQDAHRS